MKKITLMMFALATSFAFNVNAQNATQAEIILSQTSGTLSDGGVACGDSGAGTTGDNYYFRSYKLSDYGVTGPVQLKGITFNVSTSSGDTELQVMAFDYPNFPTGFDVTALPAPLATGTVEIDPSMVGMSVYAEFDTPGIADQNSNIVAVVFEPDGQIASFYLATAENETQTSYLASVACEITNPVPVADIGFPGAKHVIDLTIDDVLSVNDVLAQSVSVYPNPASSVLNISVPSNIQVENSSLVDMLGRKTGVVYSNGEMNVSGIAPGVYFLTLETNLGSYTQKIVKQ